MLLPVRCACEVSCRVRAGHHGGWLEGGCPAGRYRLHPEEGHSGKRVGPPPLSWPFVSGPGSVGQRSARRSGWVVPIAHRTRSGSTIRRQNTSVRSVRVVITVG